MNGYEATTTSAIAETAGVAKGTLFLYAPTKETLLAEVFIQSVGTAWDEAFELVDPDQPLLDQLMAAFGHVIDFHEREPSLSRAFLRDLQFVVGAPQEELHDFMQQWHRRLNSLLDTAVQHGRLDLPAPVEVLGDNLFFVWHALLQQRHVGRLPAEALVDRCRAGFALQLVGLTPDRPETD